MKIVVGFKGTAEGKAALEWAIEEASRRNAEVFIVASIRGGGSSDAELDTVRALEEGLEEAERRLTDAGIAFTIRRFARGNSPAEDLNEVVSEEGADMIVIGLRRRSAVGKFFLGSNAQEILSTPTAQCWR